MRVKSKRVELILSMQIIYLEVPGCFRQIKMFNKHRRSKLLIVKADWF